MLDVTKLQDAIIRLNAQVEATVGTDKSAAKALIGVGDLIKAAVAEALTTDAAANQGSIDAAMAAIDATIAPLAASSGDLASAIAANAGGGGQPPASL